jgi:DNA-directed RNA polymerase specialized sigma24 family protein
MAASSDTNTRPDAVGETHNQERDDALLIDPPPITCKHSNQELHDTVRLLIAARSPEETLIVALHRYHRRSFGAVADRLDMTESRVTELYRSLQIKVRRAEAKRAADSKLARDDAGYRERHGRHG